MIDVAAEDDTARAALLCRLMPPAALRSGAVVEVEGDRESVRRACRQLGLHPATPGQPGRLGGRVAVPHPHRSQDPCGSTCLPSSRFLLLQPPTFPFIFLDPAPSPTDPRGANTGTDITTNWTERL